MIKIDSIQLSKSTVKTGEAVLLKITAREELAKWNDTKTKTWGNIKNKTYEDLKLKIF